MNPKSGKAPNPVAPAAPTAPEAADVADPGEVAKLKKEQIEQGKGKYGSTPVKAHKPGGGGGSEDDEDEEDTKTSWIEIEMVDEEDQPVAGMKYEVTLPDDTVAKGTLDQNGFARIEGIEPGECKITFPDLDKDAWEKA